MKKILELTVVAFLGGTIAIGGYKMFVEKSYQEVVKKTTSSMPQMVKTNYTPAMRTLSSYAPTNFTEAAEKTIHAVVHVKNTAVREIHNPYDFFFGGGGTRKQEQIGTGSGVIISSDGYIVTNNHVIEGATDLQITLNNQKKYKATLIGTSKENDIAVLKIDADKELPYIPFGDSNNAKIGEWVLAVGNPYNLNSTVTAGIVSAKGRDLGGNGSIDAFIQTDAAVNPGNSGGALVNTRGELIGINTAITSRTGSYIGYSFAVPSNIAKKIIDDLLEYGNVQEALIGITFTEEEDGVKIKTVSEGGGAEKAGLKEGDIIKRVNNVEILKFSHLKGQLSAKRPGDKLVVIITRNGKELKKTVVLGKKNFIEIRELGLILQELSKKDLRKHKIKSGVKIIQNVNRSLKYYGVKKGFIITSINKLPVKDMLDARERLTKAVKTNSPLFIEVINLEGKLERYGFNQ